MTTESSLPDNRNLTDIGPRSEGANCRFNSRAPSLLTSDAAVAAVTAPNFDACSTLSKDAAASATLVKTLAN